MANSKALDGATALVAIVAVAAIGWGYSQSHRVNQLTASLDAAQNRIMQLQKRDLPVTMSFRKPLLGSGLVATFRNNSGRPITALMASYCAGEMALSHLRVLALNLPLLVSSRPSPWRAF